MRAKSSIAKKPAEQVVKDIRRATRRHFSAEDKTRIVLDGLRGKDSIAELCRKEGIAQSLYYTWSKDFMEAGKRRLAGRCDCSTVLMISSFSDAGYLIRHRPHPRECFF